MIYEFLYPLHTMFSSFNVFRYITFRTILAAVTALLICLFLGQRLIEGLQRLQIDQQIREDGPKTHLTKKGTPTMGGVLIIFAVVISTVLWGNWGVGYVWLALMVTIGYGLVGFLDDYRKLAGGNSRGISGKKRLAAEIVIALFVGVVLYLQPNFSTQITIPFFKTVLPDIGWGYIPLCAFIIVGAANAVNLTDGLDGLATGPAGICFVTYVLFAYFAGNIKTAGYLQIPYVPGAGELSVFCGAFMGAALGFLWFNSHPAEIFMGDVGSLSMGGALGTVAVITKQEILLAIVGGVFVMETFSVIFQVGYFKLTGGKRIFRMAPIHHHFELKGWAEPKVIVRFWIISILLALLAISTLKLR
ncbi:MAG TPA: phospho-N-acetylmuramoyl-pentapeptide-transferase [Smithellaceae bacterium]|nr:phospho-N-acetylmuramoyl-pentapeptide-transferase [Smithellaceae bacterium]HQF83674.1 phospho-N-acetylmuramoyl-pentapeptide-transferase [Smithellaceae bacterium]HQG79777.1 phospho-N-acetylmuramoyl-pentapeptide-transferase [Smithellaceae bacterium]